MQLVLSSNSLGNSQTLDLSNYIDVATADPANPAFTDKIFSRSLLKEGGVLALESFNLRELVFPLKINATTSTGMIAIEQEINQIVNTPGATVSWQDDGLTQATTFDLQTGQFDVEYNYRASQQHWLIGKLRLFGQPFGRTASPRFFAAASGVGPVLMISPYASGGALIIGASGAGFGGVQQPSGGVFYGGNPSLAGDAPAQLQIGWSGMTQQTVGGLLGLGVAYTAVSLLPDRFYQPIIKPHSGFVSGGSIVNGIGADAVQGTYYSILGGTGGKGLLVAYPQNQPITNFPGQWAASAGVEPTTLWAGNHRLFAIARASENPGVMTTIPNTVIPFTTTATVAPGGWGLYDLGTFGIRASQAPYDPLLVSLTQASGAMDVTALVMLPDATTWYLNPAGFSASNYAVSGSGFGGTLYSHSLVIDDLLGDQFAMASSSSFAPSPPGQLGLARITPFSRGLVPRPDPKNGPPIIAILGVNQWNTVGGSIANTQVQGHNAMVFVTERSRYVLP